MGRRLSLFLALVIALFVGVVPLRICSAVDSGVQGVVALGSHSHHGHADGSSCSHDDSGCALDSDARHDADHDDDDCCVDSPFHVVASIEAVSADRVLDVTVAVCVVPASSFGDVVAASPTRESAPPDVNDPAAAGLVSTVLLR